MEKGDRCIVIKPTARMDVGTEVEVVYVSKVEQSKPIWAQNIGGQICAWYALDELEKRGETDG